MCVCNASFELQKPENAASSQIEPCSFQMKLLSIFHGILISSPRSVSHRQRSQVNYCLPFASVSFCISLQLIQYFTFESFGSALISLCVLYNSYAVADVSVRVCMCFVKLWIRLTSKLLASLLLTHWSFIFTAVFFYRRFFYFVFKPFVLLVFVQSLQVSVRL